MIHEGSGHISSTSTASGHAVVVRGAPSWSYIYITLGFAITIGGTLITMVPPDKLPFPWNAGCFIVAIGVLTWLWVFDGLRFQDRLLRLEQWYENRAR